jgi:hypothetical protein
VKVVHFPLSLGRYDRVEPRLAPLGVLAACKNLRVQKDGRLVSRTGYVPQAASTATGGTLVPFDLHEFNSRLLALGNDSSDGVPTELFEFVNLASAAWRGTDVSSNPTLTPFTNPLEVAGISQVGDGIAAMSAAAGGGFVALAWRTINTNDTFCLIARQDTGQVLHHEKVVTDGNRPVLTFAVDTFYLQVNRTSGDLSIFDFTPGTDLAFQTFATPSTGNASNSHDLVPVTNASTWRVASASGETGTTAKVRIYNSAGAQQGSTATNSAITSIVVSVDVDQVDNTINLFSVFGTNTAQLRTFNATTGVLTLGPTATTVGVSGALCRVPPVAPQAASIAVVVNDANSNAVCQFFSQAAHALVLTTTAQRALCRSRPVVSTYNLKKRGVVFSGVVAPALPAVTDTATGIPVASNALFYLTDTDAHMATRDVGNAVDMGTISGTMGGIMNLQRDTSSGRLAWIGARNTSVALGGLPLAQPSVTLISFRSTARRQSAQYGGLLYFTGAPVQAYDGTILSELGFNEIPGIYSATPAAGGSLNPSAQYTYAHHWEYTRADGSLEQSPPSIVFQANTGAAQTQNTLVVSTPHSTRVALGGLLFGGSVISVLSRTVWDPVTQTSGSVFRRCVVKQVPTGMANYGAPLTILDQVSDITLATQGVIYTQGEHGELSGPVENDAPEGCSYISSSSARLAIAGLARPFEFTESKEAFLDEPVNFSSLSSFYGKISKPVVGILSLDGVRALFSRDAIYAVTGAGVNDIGGGRLPPAVEIPTASGLKDWRSLLKAPDGIYFQLDDDKLYQMPRGSGAPTWAAVDIQDTLDAFPTITGACLNRRDDSIAFACQNLAGNDSRILVRSLRTTIWSEDTPPLQAAGDIKALVNVGDGMAYISGALVYIQSQTVYADAGSVITTQWKTNPLYPFELGGYGTLHAMLATGEFRSAGTLALRVSYDDGVTFQTYDSFVLTGLTVGATFQRRWALQQSDLTSVVFEWTFTPSAPGEGCILLGAAMLVDPEAGQLKQLDPAEMA